MQQNRHITKLKLQYKEVIINMGFNKGKGKFPKSDFRKQEDLTGSKGTAKPEEEKGVADLISKIAVDQLPASSYNIKADPYTEINQPTTTYHLLAPFNKRIGNQYGGKDNINGGNVSQYADSYSSGFLNSFDICNLSASVNYRYLPIKAGVTRGAGIVNKYLQSVSTALSQLDSTTYSLLAFNDYYIETDLPMGTNASGTIIEGDIKRYIDRTPVLYGTSIVYQLVLQSVNDVISKINKFRAYQGACNKMAWQRELDNLLTLQGQFNKSAFLNLAGSLCHAFQGEYFDHDWATQYNTLNVATSRESNSMDSPLIELELVHSLPSNFKLKIYDSSHVDENNNHNYDLDVTVFDINTTFAAVAIDPSTGAITPTTFTIGSMVDMVAHVLSLYAVQLWARQVLNGTTPIQYDSYYNLIVSAINALNIYLTGFKAAFTDYRTCLNTVARTGLVTWKTGYQPGITNITNLVPENYVTISQIMKTALSGMDTIQYDAYTKRLRGFSLWSKTMGIPGYDAKQSGCVLSLSTKNTASGVDTTYLPVMLELRAKTTNNNTYYVRLQNRSGYEAFVNYEVINQPRNTALARLYPLASQINQHATRIPYVTNEASLSNMNASMLFKTLMELFGLVKFHSAYHVDTDIFAVYDYEIDDLTNAVINYISMHSVFMGGKGFSDDILGFLGQ